jgi:hypothetical protein
MKAYKTYKSRLTTNSREYKILTRDNDPYWDEGYRYHRPKGQRSNITRNWRKKELLQYQVRKYRTWKHNRKTQWK